MSFSKEGDAAGPVLFDSLEELASALTLDDVCEIMSVAAKSGIQSMYSFYAMHSPQQTYESETSVYGLSLLYMTSRVLYEIGYIGDDEQKLVEYCARDFLVEQGLYRSSLPAEDGPSGETRMEIGASVMDSSGFEFNARAPRGRKVKFDFRNLSRRGRGQLREIEQIHGSVLNFTRQWLSKNKAEVLTLLMQWGLETVPGVEIFSIACTLLPLIGRLPVKLKILGGAKVTLLAFCATITTGSVTSYYADVLSSSSVSRTAIQNLQKLLVDLGLKYAGLPSRSFILSFAGMVSEKDGANAVQLSTMAVLLYTTFQLMRRCVQEYKTIYNPQFNVVGTHADWGRGPTERTRAPRQRGSSALPA